MIAIIANSTIIPNGTRRKNTHRQPSSSERKPPTVGPIIGPKTTPIPNIAVAVPCSFCGKVSKTIAIAIGTSGAPKPPWRIRKITNCSRFCDKPQKVELIINPETHEISMLRRLKREASQPEAGVTTAVATILNVTTNAI